MLVKRMVRLKLLCFSNIHVYTYHNALTILIVRQLVERLFLKTDNHTVLLKTAQYWLNVRMPAEAKSLSSLSIVDISVSNC